MTPRSCLTSRGVSLRQLFPQAQWIGGADLSVESLTAASSDCRPGDLFVAIRGNRFDGHSVLDEVLRRGAIGALVERPQNVDLVQCIIPNTREAYGILSATLAGFPSKDLTTIGVTGTNGKTTTTWLIRSLLKLLGVPCGLLGTIEWDDTCQTIPAEMTTPDAKTISHWLSSVREHDARYAVFECSSHALDQNRLAGTGLDLAVVTNVTQDHFDYHGDFEHYLNSKRRILEHLKPKGISLINLDDPGSSQFLGCSAHRSVTYGIHHDADVSALILSESIEGSRFRIQCQTESLIATTRLIGTHNISNCLAALAALNQFGFSFDEMVEVLPELGFVPGRMESIEVGQPFQLYVDYAHTPDALGRALSTLRKLTQGKLICVFGAGGDRDRLKRPLMGEAVAKAADMAILTSDNPRSEAPEQILKEIEAGMAGGRAQIRTVVDRREAILHAVSIAGPDDCVLIAGKGHEVTQVINQEKYPFDDRKVARELIGSPRQSKH